MGDRRFAQPIDADDAPIDDASMVELFPAAFKPHVPPTRPDMVDRPMHMHGATTSAASRPLSTRARTILSLEIRGHTKEEIARHLSMRPETIGRITISDRYLAARDALLDRMDADFTGMKPAVFRALRAGLHSRDENTALRASETWMKAAGFGQYGKGSGVQGVTAEDVARQLLEVNVNVNVDRK
jgi:hypothetical protein